MYVRIFSVALATTLIATIPLYFLANNQVQITLSELPVTLLGVFMVATVSALIAVRTTRNTASGDRESGQVKWFNANKGFGFITRDNGEDIFVHFRSIRGKGRRVLRDGQRVEFAVTESDKGLQAEDVAVAG